MAFERTLIQDQDNFNEIYSRLFKYKYKKNPKESPRLTLRYKDRITLNKNVKISNLQNFDKKANLREQTVYFWSWFKPGCSRRL